jgi:phosphate-selective porin OprO/OprP
VIHYTRHAVFAAALTLAGSARAQTAPPADPAPVPARADGEPAVPPAGTVAPEAPVPAPAPPPADTARLDEIEQTARIALRKHELLEEEAAKRAKEAPKVTIDDKGFALGLPDKSYVLKIRALVQTDARFFFDDQNLQANDTFFIRRFRPSLDGTLFSLVDFRMVPELAGTVTILDAYVDIHPREWLRFRVGKMKGPVGLERLQSDADLALLERALTQNLSSQRDIGAQLWGDVAGGIVHYVAGVFNGDPDTTAADADINYAKDFAGRLFFRPFRTDGLRAFGNLGIGLSAQTGNRKGRLPTSTLSAQTGLAPYKTAGQNTFFQYLAPATDTTGAQTTFTHERASRLNPQLYYYYGPFGLLAEYVWLRQGVQKGNTTTQLTQQAAHATATFTIGGTEDYDGATPEHAFDPGAHHLGALQLAVRFGWLGIDDATFPTYANPLTSARTAKGIAGGANWVLRRSFRIGVLYEQTWFEGGAGTAATATAQATMTNRPAEYLLQGRAQVNF